MTTGGAESRRATPAENAHVVADQSEVAAFLGDPGTHGAGVTAVERIDTHAAMVFLAGARAYKVKRAVKFPYMDFSTLARRHAFCEKEVAINRPGAPDLYLGVTSVTRRPDGGLALGGAGEAVEWTVVMRRFAQEGLFDQLARAGALTPELMRDAADAVAAFHDSAERLWGVEAAGGGAAGLRWVIAENRAEFTERPDLFAPPQVARFSGLTHGVLARLETLLDERLAAGFVRRCHGDLHLRNICLIDGRPTLFDAIEFNDKLAAIDVLYDLAFLLMDLEQGTFRPYANLVLNRYMQHRGDLAGLAAMPLFLSARAAVRAKVSASAEASQAAPEARERLRAEASAYFRAAARYLDPPPARLIAIGGYSGSGKTELARRLAPWLGAAPGAVHLRSDVLRKQLFHVGELDPLPKKAYEMPVSRRVYADLAAKARVALAAGQSVVADALHARPEERGALEALARTLGVRFDGVWLDVSEAALLARVAAREADASDATARVVRQQLGYELGDLAWRRLDASGPLDTVSAAARDCLSI